MVLQAILEGYGPEYILPLVDRALLREACIEAFGRGHPSPSEATTACPAVAPTLPVARMASELMMSFHRLDRYGSSGRDVVVRLGEDAFTPDVYVYADPADPRQGSYYFDGAPGMIVEVMHPVNRDFDTGLRLSRYQAVGVPEAKFEWSDDRPHIGGGYDTNLHITGLLLMTLGLTKAVGLLPAEV